jgi:hypothetical protein
MLLVKKRPDLEARLTSSRCTILAIASILIKALLIGGLGICASLLCSTASALVNNVARVNGVLLIFFYEQLVHYT